MWKSKEDALSRRVGVMVDKIKLWQGRKGRGAMVDILANVNSACLLYSSLFVSRFFNSFPENMSLYKRIIENGDRDGSQSPCSTYFQCFSSTFLLRH